MNKFLVETINGNVREVMADKFFVHHDPYYIVFDKSVDEDPDTWFNGNNIVGLWRVYDKEREELEWINQNM